MFGRRPVRDGDTEGVVTREVYLRALEGLRVAAAPEYKVVVEYQKQLLENARSVIMSHAAQPRDYIANVAIAKGVKIRTLATLVRELERTIDELAAPAPELDPEVIPIGV
jgi:hypothetical protein